MTQKSKIVYTLTDEAPYTYSFYLLYKHLPQQQVLKWKLKTSLWLPEFYPFPEFLNEDQKVEDALSELGNLANLLTQTSLNYQIFLHQSLN
jgi:isocitrate dehydrogenase